MIIRLAMPHEVEDIVEMAEINVRTTLPHELQAFSPDRVRETFDAYLKTADPTFFVCVEKDRVIGFLMARMVDYDYRDGFFTTQSVLFVRPENRGTRAAVMLMKELIAWSEMLGAAEIHGGNDNAFQSERTAKFLEHFGFERIGFAMKRRIHG